MSRTTQPQTVSVGTDPRHCAVTSIDSQPPLSKQLHLFTLTPPICNNYVTAYNRSQTTRPLRKVILIDVNLMVSIQSMPNGEISLIVNMEMFEFLKRNFEHYDYLNLFSETADCEKNIAFKVSKNGKQFTISTIKIIKIMKSIACRYYTSTEHQEPTQLYKEVRFFTFLNYPSKAVINLGIERFNPPNERVTILSADHKLLEEIANGDLKGCNTIKFVKKNIMQHDTEVALQFALTQLRNNSNEEISILLDYDDTLIDVNETNKMRKPIIIRTTAEKIAYLCGEIRREFPKADIKFKIISARATDKLMQEYGEVNQYVFVSAGLPLFFAEVEKLMGEKFSILPEDIYCLGELDKNGALRSPLKAEFLTKNSHKFASTNIFFDDSNRQLPALNKLSKMGILKLSVVRVTSSFKFMPDVVAAQQTSAVSVATSAAAFLPKPRAQSPVGFDSTEKNNHTCST